MKKRIVSMCLAVLMTVGLLPLEVTAAWAAETRQLTASSAQTAAYSAASGGPGARNLEELERDGFLENVPGKGCFVAPQNRELLREAQLRRAEEFLAQAVEEARKGGITLEELDEMLAILYKGDIL